MPLQPLRQHCSGKHLISLQKAQNIDWILNIDFPDLSAPLQRVLPCRAHSSAPETTACLNVLQMLQVQLLLRPLPSGLRAPLSKPAFSAPPHPFALVFIPPSTSPSLACIPVLSTKTPLQAAISRSPRDRNYLLIHYFFTSLISILMISETEKQENRTFECAWDGL